MSNATTIARPYAKAVFDFAVQNNQLEQWGDLLHLMSAIACEEKVKPLLTGGLSFDKQTEIFAAIVGDSLDTHGRNLIQLMAKNNRLTVLPEVYAYFLFLVKAREKRVDAEVISACKLTAKQQSAIVKKLEARLDCEVTLNCTVDESLLGGVIIRAKDLVIDNSTRGNLNRLSETLQS